MLDPLRAMLTGDGPLLLPYAAGQAPPGVADQAPPYAADQAPPGVAGQAPGSATRPADPDGVGAPRPDPDGTGAPEIEPAGVAVATSGSTGAPKRAVLPAAALRASAAATHQVLGGPGRWLLALPPHHIAGLQVVLRSLLAGYEPAPGPIAGFTPQAFVDAVRAAARTGEPPRYVSLVPTQVARLLDDPAGTGVLAGFDAVLVGGAATDPALLGRAREAGVRVVTTYGMSETAGGCVYDGRPLPGVQVRLEPLPDLMDHAIGDLAGSGGTGSAEDTAGMRGTRVDGDDGSAGRILLGGPVVATGYLRMSSSAFETIGGTRWFRTDDLGTATSEGLRVRGRLDDIVNTGGLKVAAHLVAEALARELPGVNAVVLGLPDSRWGEVVTVVVVADGPRAADVRAGWPDTLTRLRAHLPAHAVPRRLETVAELPLRGPGKPDLAALRSRLTGADDRP